MRENPCYWVTELHENMMMNTTQLPHSLAIKYEITNDYDLESHTVGPLED